MSTVSLKIQMVFSISNMAFIIRCVRAQIIMLLKMKSKYQQWKMSYHIPLWTIWKVMLIYTHFLTFPFYLLHLFIVNEIIRKLSINNIYLCLFQIRIYLSWQLLLNQHKQQNLQTILQVSTVHHHCQQWFSFTLNQGKFLEGAN